MDWEQLALAAAENSGSWVDDLGWTEIIVAVLAFLGGNAVTAWTQWARATSDRRYTYHEELINSWKNMIDQCIKPDANGWIRVSPKLLADSRYRSLRGRMNKAKEQELDRIKIQPSGIIPLPAAGQRFLNIISEEVSRLEKKWLD